MLDSYISKRRQIEREELGMTAQQKIGAKEFKIPGRRVEKVGAKA
jgi:hypothetical protein